MFSKPERVIDKAYLAWVREMSCLACNKYPSEPDHIKTRASGGGDEHWNIWPLCRRDHALRHLKGLRYMTKHYLACRRFLDNNGWTYEEHTQKYIHASDSLSDPGDSSSSLQPMRITTEQSTNEL